MKIFYFITQRSRINLLQSITRLGQIRGAETTLAYDDLIYFYESKCNGFDIPFLLVLPSWCIPLFSYPAPWNHDSHVSGCLADLYHFYPCDCYLHLVPEILHIFCTRTCTVGWSTQNFSVAAFIG
ncbi:Uncharacterized protein TCM_000327 [Theobroma cacao]|uniref:Uncharacterized protein n=1 Tax=Theobroma cacao TaxID=3641 RepID=A0A061DFM5_THECC|nr:Uncharacterized protein TCM_000327 [Theobroma cacao]